MVEPTEQLVEPAAARLAALVRHRRPRHVSPRRKGARQGLGAPLEPGTAGRRRGDRSPGREDQVPRARSPTQRACQGHRPDHATGRLRALLRDSRRRQPRPRTHRAHSRGGRWPRRAHEPPPDPDPGVPPTRVRGGCEGKRGAAPRQGARGGLRLGALLHRWCAGRRADRLARDALPGRVPAAGMGQVQLREVDAVVEAPRLGQVGTRCRDPCIDVLGQDRRDRSASHPRRLRRRRSTTRDECLGAGVNQRCQPSDLVVDRDSSRPSLAPLRRSSQRPHLRGDGQAFRVRGDRDRHRLQDCCRDTHRPALLPRPMGAGEGHVEREGGARRRAPSGGGRRAGLRELRRARGRHLSCARRRRRRTRSPQRERAHTLGRG